MNCSCWEGSNGFSLCAWHEKVRADAIVIGREAAGAALAALRDRIERVAQDLDDERGRRKGPGDGTLAAVVHTLRTLLATESGAAPAAGEVARVGVPGQPFGYATGGNEPAPAAPAAPALDPELRQKIADRLALAYNRNPVLIAELCDEQIDRSGNLLGWLREVARLANPEKP